MMRRVHHGRIMKSICDNIISIHKYEFHAKLILRVTRKDDANERSVYCDMTALRLIRINRRYVSLFILWRRRSVGKFLKSIITYYD